jgi:quinol-cytochrome oxidoreductase complex cytochrome b subunit
VRRRSSGTRRRSAALHVIERPLNRRYLPAALFLLSSAISLFIGFRSEPRETVWIVFGLVFLVFGLARLSRARVP